MFGLLAISEITTGEGFEGLPIVEIIKGIDLAVSP